MLRLGVCLPHCSALACLLRALGQALLLSLSRQYFRFTSKAWRLSSIRYLGEARGPPSPRRPESQNPDGHFSQQFLTLLQDQRGHCIS